MAQEGSGDKATSSASSASSAIQFGAFNADGTLTPIAMIAIGILVFVGFGSFLFALSLINKNGKG